jgi:hypothetical protein
MPVEPRRSGGGAEHELPGPDGVPMINLKTLSMLTVRGMVCGCLFGAVLCCFISLLLAINHSLPYSAFTSGMAGGSCLAAIYLIATKSVLDEKAA